VSFLQQRPQRCCPKGAASQRVCRHLQLIIWPRHESKELRSCHSYGGERRNTDWRAKVMPQLWRWKTQFRYGELGSCHSYGGERRNTDWRPKVMSQLWRWKTQYRYGELGSCHSYGGERRNTNWRPKVMSQLWGWKTQYRYGELGSCHNYGNEEHKTTAPLCHLPFYNAQAFKYNKDIINGSCPVSGGLDLGY